MYGYIIQKPQMIPKIIWACKTQVEQYDWQNRNSANMIEFNICKTPKRTIILMDQPPEIIEGDAFSCIMGNEKWKSYAEDDIPVEIISVAVSFDQFSYTPKELDIEEIADTQSILLPRFQKEMPEQTMARLENLLYRVIELYKEHSASTEMMCGAIVLRIMFELDQIARQNIKNKRDKYIHYYVDKTESILLRQYAEKLTVKGVAEELSISPNYLSAIFKASTGIGFTDRLLEIRMKKAADLLMRKGLHESKVAPLVGYEELGHFRKRFKQYFGVSIRDFCCINKELTLYHDKPQKN